MVNHFEKNNLITTKVGLTHSLKNLIWWNNISVNSFFPKCFDLTENEELDDFKNEYMFIKAESVVKKYVASEKIANLERLQVAMYACEKRLKDIDDQLDDSKVELYITDNEWSILQKEKIKAEVIADLVQQKWFKKI